MTLNASKRVNFDSDQQPPLTFQEENLPQNTVSDNPTSKSPPPQKKCLLAQGY